MLKKQYTAEEKYRTITECRKLSVHTVARLQNFESGFCKGKGRYIKV